MVKLLVKKSLSGLAILMMVLGLLAAPLQRAQAAGPFTARSPSQRDGGE